MIIAGEPSGDLQASLLMRRLQALRPQWSFFGIGGKEMVRLGFEQIVGVENLSVIGFAAVARKLFFFRRVFFRMLDLLRKRRPDLVILVDYPGFNLRFACRAKDHGFRVLYYIAPQVWAWGENRIAKLRRCVDQLITVFPFEEEYFRSRGVNVQRVGNPLLDIVKPSMSKDEFRARAKVASEVKMIALLPGSRTGEIERHLPVMLGAIAILSEQIAPIVPIVARAPEIPAERIHDIAVHSGFAEPMVTKDVYSAIAAADLALVKSGTGTVECAILGTPLVVMYKTGMINYHIARRLIKADHIAMVNLVAGKAIVPEFIQDGATTENLAQAAAELLTNEPYRHTVIENLHRVRERLGPPGGAEKAAGIIVDWLEGANNQ